MPSIVDGVLATSQFRKTETDGVTVHSRKVTGLMSGKTISIVMTHVAGEPNAELTITDATVINGRESGRQLLRKVAELADVASDCIAYLHYVNTRG